MDFVLKLMDFVLLPLAEQNPLGTTPSKSGKDVAVIQNDEFCI